MIINKNKVLWFHELMLFSLLFPVPKLETYYNYSETSGPTNDDLCSNVT